MRLASLVFFPGPSFSSTICLKPRELLTSYMLVLEAKAVEGKRRVQVVRCVSCDHSSSPDALRQWGEAETTPDQPWFAEKKVEDL